MSWAPRPILAVVTLLLAHEGVRAEPVPLRALELLRNPLFTEWDAGTPRGWEIEVGAQRGEGPTSRIRPGAEEGIALEGAAETRIWKLVSQTRELDRDGWIDVSFEARLVGARREEGQNDNAYVGLEMAGRGAASDRQFRPIDSPEWKPYGIQSSTFAGRRLRLSIFLSKTGTLEVRRLRASVAVDTLARVVRSELTRNYSYALLKPEALSSAKRALEDGRWESEADFVDLCRRALAHLQDMHCWVKRSDGTIVPTWTPEVPRNFDYAVVMKSIEGRKGIEKVAAVGTIGDDVGYVAIGTLQFDDATLARIVEMVEGLLDRKGILLDLRANSGGNEVHAQKIAAIFADQPRVYAKSKRRAGPSPTDFTEPTKRWVKPREGKRFTGPVVVLTGPNCVSSGEGFVKAMRVLPTVTLVGQPTRGASGNPQPVDLPNGVQVWFSRWVDMLPDGTVTEGKGVPPDVLVKHEGEGDPTFRAALEVLRAKIGQEAPR
jgi:hypothetical protein